MTYPITPLPGIHKDIFDAELALQEAQQTYQGLVNILAPLPAQIANIVINAILKALGLSQFIPQVQNAENFLSSIQQNFQNGLQSALGGLIPAAVDNLDGTANPIGNQITVNLDGTATIANQLGSTAVNTIVDWADGTAMSVASALQNVNNVFGTHQYALNNWTTTLGQTGLASASQLVNSLSGLLPAALDNFDGTAVQTGVANIVQNFDGTATLVSQVGSSAISQLVDNLDGTVMSLAHSWQNAVGSAQQAGGVNNISAAMAALQRTAIGTGSEFTSSPVNVSVPFNQYPNSSSLPSIFNEQLFVNSGTGTPGVGITSGAALWNGTNTGSATVNAIYQGPTPATATDYQTISVVIGAINQNNVNTTNATSFSIWGRQGTQPSPQAFFSSGNAFIQAANGSTIATVAHNLIAGDTYTFVLGTTAGLFNYEILHNGQVLLSGTDQTGTRFAGPGNRGAGAIWTSQSSASLPASITSFSFNDDTAIYPVGSGFYAFKSSGSNTSVNIGGIPGSVWDTIQYNTPDLTFNSTTGVLTVGIPGWYSCTVRMATSAASTVNLFHNGTDVAHGLYSSADTSTYISTGFFCAAGDTVQPGINASETIGGGSATGTMTYWSFMLANLGTLS